MHDLNKRSLVPESYLCVPFAVHHKGPGFSERCRATNLGFCKVHTGALREIYNQSNAGWERHMPW